MDNFTINALGVESLVTTTTTTTILETRIDLPADNVTELFKNISFSSSPSERNLHLLLFSNIQQQQQQQQQHQQQLLPYNNRATISSLLITITTFYIIIFIAGILGNLITCFVIVRNQFMHTATNFYLFNLAISDLILLLSGMPQDLYNLWYPYSYPFTDIACIIEGVFCETAANATVLTVTAFTVERYIAICHPFRQHTMSKLSRAIKFIFSIWLTAFILALPQAMQFSVVSYDEGGKECTINDDFFAHVFAISGFVFFGGPMTAICLLYLLIGIKLKQSRLLQTMPRRCYHIQRGINSAQTRVIRMLIAVAVAFFLCWAPFHAQRLMAVYGSLSEINSELFNTIFHILDYTSGVLYFLSTCINPLLYNIMSHKFRDAFKVTLAHHFTSNKSRQNGNNSAYSVLTKRNGLFRRHYTTDSTRTNTTTTTVTSSSGVAHSSNANKIQGTSRPNIHMDTLATLANAKVPSSTYHCPRQQSQISQLSSIGDASSLLKFENIDQLNGKTYYESAEELKRYSNSCPSQNSDKHCHHILPKKNCYEKSSMMKGAAYGTGTLIIIRTN